jgi:hypothetical protein
MKATIWKLLAAVALAAVLGACSKSKTESDGGGGTTAPSSNWDSMKWDQGNWS